MATFPLARIRSRLFAGLAVLALAWPTLSIGAAEGEPFQEQPVAFDSGTLTLHGSVLVPRATDPVPGLVLVHGAGPHDRDSLRREAEDFARRGIAALIYDKRTEGYGQFERSYELLADDALAAVEALAEHPATRDRPVGLWGVS